MRRIIRKDDAANKPGRNRPEKSLRLRFRLGLFPLCRANGFKDYRGRRAGRRGLSPGTAGRRSAAWKRRGLGRSLRRHRWEADLPLCR